MKKAAEYRHHARECRALAAKMDRPDQRDHLLQMAAQWEDLATERERVSASQAAEPKRD